MVILSSTGSSNEITNTSKSSDLKIDEEINLEDDLALEEPRQTQKGSDQVESQKPDSSTDKPVTRIRWTKFAGVFLIIAFILNMWFPISFMVFINDIQTATGDTSLEGTILDSEDDPVEDVTVTITDLDLVTQTDKDGKYYFDQVPVGEQVIHYTKPGYRTVIVRKILFSDNLLSQTPDDANIIDIPGTLSSGISIDPFDGPIVILNENKFNHTLSGKVTDISGSPLSNAKVSIDNSKLNTNTDSLGSYVLNGIHLGINTINISKYDSISTTTVKFLFANENETELDIIFDNDADQIIDNTLGQTGNIEGKVVNFDDFKEARINVALFDARSNELKYNTTYNETGEYSFQEIPIGAYYLQVYDISDLIEPEFKPIIIEQVIMRSDEITEIEDMEIEKVEDPKHIKEEISSEYTYICIIILVFLAFLTLAGAISAFQRKRYPLAFMGALVGMFPVVLLFQTYICGASALCLISLILIVLAREEFEFPKRINRS